MSKYLISFPGEAMVFSEDEFQTVVEESHAVVREAKAAGVWVFGGGIEEEVSPVLVSADGTVTQGTYPQPTVRNGGFTVLEVPTREEAIEWAAKFAVVCRCQQEVRKFGDDPES